MLSNAGNAGNAVLYPTLTTILSSNTNFTRVRNCVTGVTGVTLDTNTVHIPSFICSKVALPALRALLFPMIRSAPSVASLLVVGGWCLFVGVVTIFWVGCVHTFICMYGCKVFDVV